MKKNIIIVILLILFISFNVYGTSGSIKQNSIIECNGKYYGNHGNPTHWHEVVKKDDKWVISSGEVSIPSCYIKPINEMEKVTYSKCSDGDTAYFIIKGIDTKVRFLAIDTPETDKNEPMSHEAKEYTCNALKNANEIYLEYDSNSDKEDKYGRTLAFVYVDGVLLEKTLIEQGLAKVAYIYGDYAHVDELRQIEELAKNNKIGIWSDVSTPDVKEEQEDSKEEDNVTKLLNFIIEILQKIFTLLFK